MDFVVTRDCQDFNTGAFLVRASQSALGFLEEIYGGAHVTKKLLKDLWWEQRSFIDLYAKSQGLRNHTMIVPQKTFNAYPPGYGCHEAETSGWSQGDFAVHFPGTDEGARDNLVPEYLKQVMY